MNLHTLLLALALAWPADALSEPAPDDPTPDDPVAAATPSALPAGTHRLTLEVGGAERKYVLHVPRSYGAADREADVPLVLMLHGRTSSGVEAASKYYGWTGLSEEEGFIAAFPTALGRPTSWKASWAGKPTADSEFLAALIDHLSAAFDVDADRVFMTGHSSGGFMSYSFAATHGEKVAAIGPVAGLSVDPEPPSAPVSVVSFHGMADRVVPYGRNRWRAADAVGSAERFAAHGECEPVEREELLDGRVHLDRWRNAETGVEVALYSIEGGNHGWPRGGRRSVRATELIWAFFEEHPRRQDEPASDGATDPSADGSGDGEPEREASRDAPSGDAKGGGDEGGGSSPRQAYRIRTEGCARWQGSSAGDGQPGSGSLSSMAIHRPLSA